MLGVLMARRPVSKELWQQLQPLIPTSMGFGSGMTCWRRLRDWQAARLWEQLHHAMLIRLREHDQIDWERASIDGSTVVTRSVGSTGVVGVLRNGAGPAVMLRADMDALPMVEDTGLPHASTAKARDPEGVEVGVAHSCGHDMHVTWLIGAARILAAHRDAWHGTLLIVFQPGEETAQGASAMVQDWGEGRFPKPNIIRGQHVMVGASGTVTYRPGITLSAGDSLKIRLFGRGSHSSQRLALCRRHGLMDRQVTPQVFGTGSSAGRRPFAPTRPLNMNRSPGCP